MTTFTTTITQKGQITLPKPIRDALNLDPGDRIGIVLINQKRRELALTELPKLSQLAGSFRIKGKLNTGQLRDRFERSYERR